MPPRFRRKNPAKLSRNPTLAFKLLAAVLVITFYFIITYFREPRTKIPIFKTHPGEKIQWESFKNGSGIADKEKAGKIKEAMKYTFAQYKKHAWGHDDIMPVSGNYENSRNGWGAFIVDSATTLAVMGLWDELGMAIDHIVTKINFNQTEDLVDPFETTIRYLGGLVSLVDLMDSGIIPSSLATPGSRKGLLKQAVTLAGKLAPVYDTPTGLPWTRVNFNTSLGEPDPPPGYTRRRPGKRSTDTPTIGPARSGSNILENRVLTRLTGDSIYLYNATRQWSSLVWSPYVPPAPGMVNSPINIMTGEPTGRWFHWDGSHDSYYEYLLKASLLSPHDKYSPVYRDRWLQAADSLRRVLASRSAPTDNHATMHLFLGKRDGAAFVNTQSHLSCFAPGNLLLGGAYLRQPALTTFGQALLEGCRHTYASTATGIGPENWGWLPKFERDDAANATVLADPTSLQKQPAGSRQLAELDRLGFWMVDPRFRLRPEYIESLFYAWRITGQHRYRDWGWEAFRAIEKHCKTEFGYAGLVDVMFDPSPSAGQAREDDDGGGGGGSGGKEEDDGQLEKRAPAGLKRRLLDEAQSFWAAETLKYLYLLFADTEHMSLDRWVFSTEAHPFRMIREH